MRKMTRFIWKNLILAGIVIPFSAMGQDIHFSQFYENPLNLNPALGGAFAGDYYISANYRNQWASVMGGSAAYTTEAATAEAHNILKNWGNGYLSPGLTFYSDKSGDAQLGVTEVAFNLASGIYLDDKNLLAVGLQAGYANHSINLAGLQWDDQYVNGVYNPNIASGETSLGNSFSYPDFSAGLDYNYGTGQTNMTSNDAIKGNFGIAAFHVNQPNMSYFSQTYPGSQLYMRFVVHGELMYAISNSNIDLVPQFIYFKQGPADEANLGLKLRYIMKGESKYTGRIKGVALDFGGYYRFSDAAVILGQLEFGNYAIGVSYDINVSSLTTASSGAGGFEISLRFLNLNPFIQSVTPGANHTVF